MTASQWSVITVTYNSLNHLQNHWTVDSATRGFDWIVVDNGSTDGSVEFARAHATKVIESGGNYGFSKANNIGLDALHTGYVAFANPDVSVLGTDWQQRFQRLIEHTNGFVAPQLLNSDGTLQANARGLPYLPAKIRNRMRPNSRKGRNYARAGFDTPTYCAWVMGAALAGRVSDFQRLGGWDESYFLYYEDHEIGLRAWRNGMSIAIDPEVRWVHAWQRATSKPELRAWRIELASLREFYRQHPEFLSDAPWSGARRTRSFSSKYERLRAKLWTSVESGTT